MQTRRLSSLEGVIPIPPNYDLGTAYGTIEINASSLSRLKSSLDLVGNSMLAVGGLAIAGFGYAVKSAADFEQQMSRFKAVGSATENQMEGIRKKALQLGRDSAYGATEVVKSFAELAYAGATTQDILSGLGDATVYLAAAGEIPLADAATTLINTMKQFDIPASKAVKISDEIARAANASTISVTDLVTSLRYAGPVAAQAGIGFNSTAEALAILGNEGIRGSTAGTSLRGILVGITKPSAEATAKMKDLGLITKDGTNQFFKANGEMKSFKQIAQVLQDSVRGLTKEQQLNAFGTIFQRRAMATAAILAKEGAKGFDDLSNSAQYNTNAQEIMKIKLDNLNGSLKILRASFETFAIMVGEQFTPYFKVLADVLREVVNTFSNLPGPVQKLIGAFLLLSGSSLLALGTLAKIGSSATKMYKGLKDLKDGLVIIKGALSNFIGGIRLMGTTLLTSPVFWFIIALVLLAVLFYLLYTRSETFRRGLKAIGEAAKEAGKWILAAFKTAWEWVKQNWPDLLLILLGPVGAAIIAWRHFKDQILSALKKVWDWIKSNWDLLTPILLGPFGLFIIFIRRWGDDVVRFIKTAIDKVIGFINKLPYYFGYAVGLLIGFAVLLQVKLIQLFVKLWNKLLDLLIQFTVKAANEWIKFLTQLPGILIGIITTLITMWVNFVEQMVAKAIDLGIRIITAVIQFFSQLPGLILGFITGALGLFIGWGIQMVSAMVNTGGQVLSAAVSFFSQLPGQIVGAVGDGYHLLYDWARNIITGLIDGLKSLAGKAADIASDIGHGVIGGIKAVGKVFSPSKVMHEVGRNYTQGFMNGLEQDVRKLRPVVSLMATTPQGLHGRAQWGYGGNRGQDRKGDTNITIHNPVAEAAEESISRTMQKLAYVGIAG